MASYAETERKIVEQAQKAVREHDLFWLAETIANYPPTERQGYAVHARIPWWMIHALRGMVREEKRRRREAIDAANRAAIREAGK